MTAAAPKTSKNLKFWAAMVWLRRVSSFTAMTDASEVDLSSEIALLPSAGTIARSACCMTTRRRVRKGLMPSDCAAMTWLRFTERMPPRMISPVNAASLSAKPSMAVVTDPNGSPTSGSTV